jgi:hypothetical protein
VEAEAEAGRSVQTERDNACCLAFRECTLYFKCGAQVRGTGRFELSHSICIVAFDLQTIAT